MMLVMKSGKYLAEGFSEERREHGGSERCALRENGEWGMGHACPYVCSMPAVIADCIGDHIIRVSP